MTSAKQRRRAALAERRYTSAQGSLRMAGWLGGWSMSLLEHGRAVAGLCIEARDSGSYPLGRAARDALSLVGSLWQSAFDACSALHGSNLLLTDEVSEAAGPVVLGIFKGKAEKFACTDLLATDGSGASVASEHVKFRKRKGRRLIVSLIDLMAVTPTLPPGRYTGTVRKGAQPIATLVLEHRRLGRGNTVQFAFSSR